MAQDVIDEKLKPILKYVEKNSNPDMFTRLIAVSGDIKEYRVTKDKQLLEDILMELERMNLSIETDRSS